MKDNVVFMAVKVGKESVEGNYALYKGVAALNILAVNPNKAELSELTGKDIEEEPQYVSQTEEGKAQVRVTFYARTNPESKINSDINLLIPISFILVKDFRIGQTSGKCQIIDKFGRTAWATKDELQGKKVPVYPSGPANISADYRPAWQGEEFLIDFLIQWLNIPGPANYKDKKWVMKENTEDSEVSLNMDALFKGDVSELRELVNTAKAYTVKAAIGIRSVENENGVREYQAVFTRKFLKNAVTDYSKLDAAITEFQNAGGAPNTVFSTEPLHENVIEATEFIPEAPEADPLNAGGGSPATPWG